MLQPNIVALSVFLVAYCLFIALPNRRTLIAALAALLLLLTKTISPGNAFMAINWNVMGIFIGTLALADIFMKSRAPAYLAEMIVNHSKNTLHSMLWICAITGFISAFVENVATVLIIAPIALNLAKKIKLQPVSLMIAIAISSNLQGAATLIGDPPSMLLGGFANMNFGDFFFYQGRPSIFFAVELGALFSFGVLYYLFRKHREKVKIVPVEKITSWVPTFLLVLLVFLLAGSSFINTGFEYTSGFLCLIMGVVALIWDYFSNRTPIHQSISGLDWDTTLFLAAIFILVGSLTLTGWIEVFSSAMVGLVGQNIFLGYTTIVFASVILSAFIDNVPFLVAMLPLTISLADKLAINPSLFLFGLLIGASLGGNTTPIGASANIVACGLSKKEGYPIKFMEFVKIGLPFTLAAVIPAYLFIWLVWGR